MNKLNVEEISIDNLKIKIESSSKNLKLIFSGKIDMEYPSDSVLPFLEKIYNQIIEAAIKKVVVNVTGLQYLNSSGIRTFLIWLNKSKKLSEDEQYRVEVEYAQDSHWQSAIFPTFKKINNLLIDTKAVS